MPAISLPGSFDITAVIGVASDLADALGRGGLVLDARQVSRVDAASLQLLCAAVATARARGVQVGWVGASAALTDGARTLGLTAALGLPAAPAQEVR